MRVALIGTRGVPARYGGFETAIEEVGKRLVNRGHEVIVFRRPPTGEGEPPTEYLGMRLVNLPVVPKRSLETLSHTALSVINPALSGVDSAILFNAANAPLMPVLRLRGIPFATHVDGLEWKRAKWGPVGKTYYRMSESLAVRWSEALIADARGIADYYSEEFGAPTRLISYGAPILVDAASDKLASLDLEPREYHLVVARFEPENHVLEIVRGYTQSSVSRRLIVVGSAPYADEYTEAIANASDDRVRLVGGVWDQELLDQLYANSLSYLHGHSVGGTNPSLLRAAGAGAFVVAYDVAFNREVMGEFADYFGDSTSVSAALRRVEADLEGTRARGLAGQCAIERYSWDDVTIGYEELLEDLAKRGQSRRRERASGRRQREKMQP